MNLRRCVELALKRVMDVVVSSIGLVVASPLMLATAIAVKATSAGPIIFSQARIGQGGTPFTIYKFRTMEIDHAPSLEPVRGEHHKITRIGKFLRNTGIDELPQLFNVLKGDMSLVGPRPHADYHAKYYAEHIAEYPQRFVFRPGITGAVQVSDIRNLSHTMEEVRAQIALDLEYIAQWRLMDDIRIGIKTFFVLVGRYQKTRKFFNAKRKQKENTP